jgi:peptide/nickel transport system substrate-binding protein
MRRRRSELRAYGVARKAAYAKALALIEERAHAQPLFARPISYIADKDLQFTIYPEEIPRWETSWK